MIKDIKNKRFGKLKVIRMVQTPMKDTRHGKWWLCECDCGNQKIMMGVSLRTGKSKSCGCGNKATQFQRSGRTEINIIYYSYKKSASDRDLVFDIDFATFTELVKGNCFYCNRSPSQTLDYYKWTQGFTYNGIDRLDSSKGYAPDNVVSSCSKCNYAKRSMPARDFYDWIEKLYLNLRLKGEIK
ncbi:hypothetical protein A2191_03500 [Candidatus Woesebacteria bacterium RIFOXYA1_FULL_38_9]|nr:MAG: hypothetical protein A2191_03500 [Candidatus Woesebacteria bacterium RIFOXYA1_FULL_38_9]